MKRILALILCLFMLLPLVACEEKDTPATAEATETKEETKKETEEKKEEPKKTAEETKNNHVVNDPLTWDDINAIPIANSSMSIQQLRDICVDFFNLSMSFTYIPSANYNYVVESQNLKRTLEKGTLYGGIPYITVGGGNLYRIMDFYDSETGILDMTPFTTNYKLLGNACSGGANLGWARCINSAKMNWTANMVPVNGYLKIGPYEYDTTLTGLGVGEDDYSHKNVCAQNGEQVMYESYAVTHKADGIVNPGHVRMISAEPVVVRNADGTINGKESYLICSDQICYNTNPEKYGRVQEDGTTYHIAGGKDWKYSFKELFGDAYIPFTFAEFLGTDPVEDAQVTISAPADANVTQLQNSVISANYVVTDVYLKVKDSEGKELFNYARRKASFRTFEWDMSDSVPAAALNPYAGKGNTIEISCQLGNGERPVIYTGILN